jgi:uncharacterized protein with von Willebrand factor type A (vWA) domain
VTDAFAANLVHFVRHLRARGLAVVPATSRDLASAIDIVGLTDRDDVYNAMRALVVMRPSEREVFDEAFQLYFGAGGLWRRPPEDDGAASRAERPGEVIRAGVPVLTPRQRDETDNVEEDVTDIVGGSYEERLASRDFRDLTPEEKEEVRRLIARMVWRPADTRSRRWEAAKRGPRPDLRRTFRSTVRPEGDLLPLALQRKKMRRRPLIILADVSGSMERYTEMFLHFIHATQGRLGRVEAFVFATRLNRVTRQMRFKLPEVALLRVAATVEDWSGGTRIGEALEAFNREWSRRVTGGGAIGLIISDGWDTGDPAVLEREMRRFARSVHRVVWLNPLASRPGFAAETRGLRTVLPFVDDFLAAGRLDDLRSVVRMLESVSTRPGPKRLLPPQPVANDAAM